MPPTEDGPGTTRDELERATRETASSSKVELEEIPKLADLGITPPHATRWHWRRIDALVRDIGLDPDELTPAEWVLVGIGLGLRPEVAA